VESTSVDMSKDALELVLIEDHPLYRRGLRELLEVADPTLRVTGEASTGEEGIELARRLSPDVVLMDLYLPGMSGIDATRRLLADAPGARVLVLTGSKVDSHVVDAIMAGASGYLLKDSPVEEIVRGVHAAAAGDALLSPAVAAHLIGVLRTQRGDEPEPGPEVELTEREREVLRLVARGLENSEIAHELTISPRTARNHVSNILTKLQIDNRIQAAVYAVRRGLI